MILICTLLTLAPSSLAQQPTVQQGRVQQEQVQAGQVQAGQVEPGQAQPRQTQPAQTRPAQPRGVPQIRLNTLEPVAGETVTITGLGLPPGSQVTARLTAPSGVVTREGSRVEENGRFRLALPLPVEGNYQLVLRGQNLDETRTLEVQRAQPVQRGDTQTPAPAQPRNPPATSLTAQPEAGTDPQTPPRPNEAAATDLPSPEPPTPAPRTPKPLEITRVGRTIEARQGSVLRWRLTFPVGSGDTTEPLSTGENLYVGHGNSVLRLEPETGNVTARFIVSGPVTRVERVSNATTAITVRHSRRVTERFTLRSDTLQETVRFGVDPHTFGYLRAEAAGEDTALRLRRDPTNPWLSLALGLEQGSNPETAHATFSRAVGLATTFYDLAGIAQVLEENGKAELAERAFTTSMQDFAARGYDPQLLRDEALEAAYNFPLGPLRAALRQNDDILAGRWAERLMLAAPNVPGARTALREYAALLRPFAPAEQVALWERRAEGGPETSSRALDRAATKLGLVGWAAAAALFTAFFSLHLTLLAKYALARRVDSFGSGRVPWLFTIRYYTLTEKLVLLLLLAGVLALGALANWYGMSREGPDALRSGTLANRPAEVYLEDAPLHGPRAASIRGYAAHVAGRSSAEALLREAGDYAPALNNLGVLTNDAALYGRALNLEPTLAAARYNTGDTAALPFAAAYAPDQPALAAPSPSDFLNASSEPWQTALTRAFTRPWLSLQSPAPHGLSPALWRGAELLFVLLVLVNIVFLVVPRPRSAHSAPRPWFYELFALLIPGSGLADEAWGIFLLVPWAIFGMGTLGHALGWSLSLGLGTLTLLVVLGGVYGLNTVAVVIEGLSHRSQRRELELRRARAKGNRT